MAKRAGTAALLRIRSAPNLSPSFITLWSYADALKTLCRAMKIAASGSAKIRHSMKITGNTATRTVRTSPANVSRVMAGTKSASGYTLTIEPASVLASNKVR